MTTQFKVPTQPLHVEDAAGRRYVVFLKQDSPKTLQATVKGRELNKVVSLTIEPPVFDWGRYARQALREAIKSTFGIEATRLQGDEK